MTRRPKHTWDINRLVELQRRLDAALKDFESQCYEAQDRAPAEWRDYWRDEGTVSARTRTSLTNIAQLWIDYAAGQHVETISPSRQEDAACETP